MSSSFHAGQYERFYRPVALGNWEVPKPDTHKKPVAKAAGHRTSFICDDRGYLKGPKKMTSFTHTEPEAREYRWPKNYARSIYKYPGASTMGYVLGIASV